MIRVRMKQQHLLELFSSVCVALCREQNVGQAASPKSWRNLRFSRRKWGKGRESAWLEGKNRQSCLFGLRVPCYTISVPLLWLVSLQWLVSFLAPCGLSWTVLLASVCRSICAQVLERGAGVTSGRESCWLPRNTSNCAFSGPFPQLLLFNVMQKDEVQHADKSAQKHV